MKIGIIGNGYVGGATRLFAQNGDKDNELVEAIVYDSDRSKSNPPDTSLDDMVDCEFVFVCVPTPMNQDGSCHLDIVESVVGNLRTVGVSSESIFIRSTVPVGTSKSLGVNFMPEFLTEANWKEDFLNTKHWIVGLNNPSPNVMDKFKNLLKMSKLGGGIKRTMVHFCSTNEAELVKYTRNCFLATKVSFFNEIHEFCKKTASSYDVVKLLTSLDDRVGASHTSVPGPDGKKGYGGTCFPKDMGSLHHQMNSIHGLPSPIIAAAIRRNKLHDRPEKDWEEDRGRAVI